MTQGAGQDSPEVTSIYTDGACSGNPGPGGWGAIANFSNGQVHEMGGRAKETTNNRMELQAAIEILQWFTASPQTSPPTLYTDSKYVQDGITKWIKGWKKKQWKTSAGKPVLNQDLWQQLDGTLQSVNAQLESPLQWQYVKGHAGNVGNERCDAIARAFSQGRIPPLSTVTSWPSRSNDSSVSSLRHNGNSASDRAETTPQPPVQTTPQNQLAMSKSMDSADYDSDSTASNGTANDSTSHLSPRYPTPLQQMIERLRVADELATHGFWVTTAELVHVVELSPSTINGKGDRWLWRNWSIVRAQQESGPILWQLSRID